jgi:hypothetical protein
MTYSTIHIAEDKKRAAKTYAAARGENLKDVIERLIDQLLSEPQTQEGKHHDRSERLPTA